MRQAFIFEEAAMRRGRKTRGGFSLVELLVVIAIMTILMGMLLGGIQRVRESANRAKASSEIAQLSSAIAAFKAKFNVRYIPAGFQLKSSYPSGDTDGAYLKQLFPQLNLSSTGLPDKALDNNQALVFFLSGGSYVQKPYTGFSINRSSPFTTADGNRIGPFFDFPTSRIVGDGKFVDPWGSPYAYFTAINGNDYSGSFNWNGTTVTPFAISGKYEQQKGFQIISAGPNGPRTDITKPHGFGTGGDNWKSNADYGAGRNGGDDIANFAEAGNLQQ